ncbi:MAG: helix-turn-helix domain-containing protein [Marinifilaceae bacterium]|jgi:AraC-like DNA-binding protein|nr:helix-turn-helix domain-containing protein [Marinifilaceae bacterium]
MRDGILKIASISELHSYLGLEKPIYPLVSVIKHDDYERKSLYKESKYSMNLYSITLKNGIKGRFKYGRNSYDYEEGTLIFTSPNQILSIGKKEYTEEPNGWSLYFHPDLLRHSDLGKNIDNFSFFSYSIHEALHLSEKEKNILTNTIHTIENECEQNIDSHSQRLITSNIQLLLEYCIRFYDRQFYTRTNINKDTLSSFERLLKDYYNSDRPLEKGLPGLKYCAEKLNISTTYLSDLLKKETGISGREHIHRFVIEKAKTNLLNSNEPINQIAYNLGFEYPSHFNKLFKAHTGMSPKEYRVLN